jgi:hypothetical protein
MAKHDFEQKNIFKKVFLQVGFGICALFITAYFSKKSRGGGVVFLNPFFTSLSPFPVAETIFNSNLESKW